MAEGDEELGRVAYEAYRDRVANVSAVNGPWDQVGERVREDWIAVGRAVRDSVRADG
jgi:hypothetical protein